MVGIPLLDLWGMWSTPSLPSLPCPLSLRAAVPAWLLSMEQISNFLNLNVFIVYKQMSIKLDFKYYEKYLELIVWKRIDNVDLNYKYQILILETI